MRLRDISITVTAIIYDLIMPFVLALFLPILGFFAKTNDYRKNRIIGLRSINEMRKNDQTCVIFYCASVGELEQAIPLIRKCEQDKKRVLIFLASKKGLDYCKSILNNEAYLTPFDFAVVWRFILKKLKPEYFIVNRHEFWPGALLAAASVSKLIVVNYVVKKHCGLIERMALLLSSFVFSVNQISLSGTKIICTGDTRVDRLLERYSAKEREIKSIKSTIRKHLNSSDKLILIGNCYLADFLILHHSSNNIFQKHKFLIVPSRSGFDSSKMNGVLRSNSIESYPWNKFNAVILDTVGNLFELLACADIAWIGGGFSSGIHNCLESNFHNIPIISGPHLAEQPDAIDLKKLGRLKNFGSAIELEHLLSHGNLVVCKAVEKEISKSPTNLIYSCLYENNYSGKKEFDSRSK